MDLFSFGFISTELAGRRSAGAGITLLLLLNTWLGEKRLGSTICILPNMHDSRDFGIDDPCGDHVGQLHQSSSMQLLIQ
jgi:hypothetical protein